ncbi:hypothetical protein acdb102_35840 [Acidothermaceae bacterium B102]|nr:hypothetical protein acdb102_35840 [Acidothermaceae bacterium B102]
MAPPLADGRYPALLKHIDGPRRTVTVDVVQWFSGKAVAAAKKQDGVSPSEAPFDFYVRNANPRLRTLAVAGDAPITVNVLASSAGDSPNSSTDVPRQWQTFARYDKYLGYTLVWITMRHNIVQKLSEQYLP